MRNLQWFPGHMTKAMRMMEDNVAVCDGIIYVLDARCPASSFNPALKKMFGLKPVLYVLNKGDLADQRADAFVKLIRESGNFCVRINAVDSRSRRALSEAVAVLVKEKREKNAQKGYTQTFRFMVCGVPNTGKSTVINLLAGNARAQTGNKAGVTRGKQWIRLEGYELLDTPGTTPPSFVNQKLAVRLAYAGSLNDDILDLDDIALSLLAEMHEKYPQALCERYGIGEGAQDGEEITPLEMLDKVCARRGFVLCGNDFDYERGEKAVIDDFRKGRLGKVTLDAITDCKDFKF
ncbi:MAG: ribosome biogenesis GTPase YlqF [Clostridiales bacterium]|nr:ribosome biogenesis GTPase YlqF [Clostridiales bacterium]